MGVFGQNWLYSSKSGCQKAKLVLFVKVAVFGQE